MLILLDCSIEEVVCGSGAGLAGSGAGLAGSRAGLAGSGPGLEVSEEDLDLGPSGAGTTVRRRDSLIVSYLTESSSDVSSDSEAELADGSTGEEDSRDSTSYHIFKLHKLTNQNNSRY